MSQSGDEGSTADHEDEGGSEGGANALGIKGITLHCPECGHTETASVGPTVGIGGDLDVEITRVNCSKCGYDGPPT